MKIYFLAAAQGISEYGDTYRSLVKHLQDLGHKVETDYIFGATPEEIENLKGTEDIFTLHKKIVSALRSADIIIAETSFQRISAGYFISIALEFGKPTVVLFEKGTGFALLETLEQNEKCLSYEYEKVEDVIKHLPSLIEQAADRQDTRFNFFISPRHQQYLDWIAKNKKLPRSVFLRTLIEEDMRNTPGYGETYSAE